VQRRNLRGDPPVVVVQNPGDVTLALPRRIGRRTDYVLALRNTAAGALNRQTVLIRLSDGQVTSLVDTVASSVPAPGYLLSPQPRGLVAIPFDAERLMLTGAPILMPEAAEWDPPSGLAALAASDTGVLAYSRAVERPVQFEWLSATGQSLGVIGAADFYGAFALSPDGSRIVARLIPGEKHPLGALRLIDIARNLTSPIVTPDALVSDPIWTVDGTRVVYRSGTSIVRQSPFSTVTEKVIDGIFYPDAFSRDGRWMLLGRADTAGAFALVAMPTDGSGPMVDVSADASASDEGSFSPDGRLVAYHSGRTGRSEIYLSPFPPTGERWQVSPDGGLQARWSADGRSLHYLDLTGKLVRVAIDADTPGRIGRPEVRFDLHIGRPSAIIEQYALHGDRVLVLRPPQVAAPLTVTVVSNWTETLPRAAAQAP
jgi:hypothetical protein